MKTFMVEIDEKRTITINADGWQHKDGTIAFTLQEHTIALLSVWRAVYVVGAIAELDQKQSPAPGWRPIL